MASMLEMAAERSSPRARAEGSLKRALSEAGAGEGVAGTGAEGAVEDEVGAWGGAGVAAEAAGAGVEGAEGFDGAALGCTIRSDEGFCTKRSQRNAPWRSCRQ